MQALDMAARDAGNDLTGLTHHSDHGSTYMAMVYTDRIVELGAIPSTGTVGPLSRSSARASNGCGGGTTPASAASSTCAPRSRLNRRTTLTTNQANHHPPDKAPNRNESQAGSGRATDNGGVLEG